LGYFAALLAILIGPGFGPVYALFPSGAITIAERTVFVIVISIGLVTGTLFGLTFMAVPLNRSNIAGAVLTLTLISTLLAILVKRHRDPATLGLELPFRAGATAFTMAFCIAVVLCIGSFLCIR
jgi:hypothetical protein